MLRRLLFILFIATIILLFWFYPKLDLVVSNVFYNEANGFYLKNKFWVIVLHKSAIGLCLVFIIGIISFTFKILMQTKSFRFSQYKKIIYIVLVCSIGPGLLVHYILKDNFGRPRPYQIMQFSGTFNYHEALKFSGPCKSDCSFPSGHASTGFMIFALAFLSSGYKRTVLNLVAITLGLSIGFARIVEGDHFLSDIIFSGIIVYIVAYILNIIIKPTLNDYILIHSPPRY